MGVGAVMIQNNKYFQTFAGLLIAVIIFFVSYTLVGFALNALEVLRDMDDSLSYFINEMAAAAVGCYMATETVRKTTPFALEKVVSIGLLLAIFGGLIIFPYITLLKSEVSGMGFVVFFVAGVTVYLKSFKNISVE